jgi:hypothetical protein
MRFAIAVGLGLLAITAWLQSGLPVSDWGVIALLLGSLAVGILLEVLEHRSLPPSPPRERQPGELPSWALYGAGVVPAVLVAVLGDPTSVWPALAGMAGIVAFFVIQVALLRISAKS